MSTKNNLPTEVLHKEIDLVQDVIKRMAGNSFLVKGWLITLFTTATIFIKDLPASNNLLLAILAILFSIISFWYIDAFFLHKEKCYRALYEHIISNKESTSRKLYSLDYRPFIKDKPSVFKLMWNTTIYPFYFIPILLTLSIVWIIFK